MLFCLLLIDLGTSVHYQTTKTSSERFQVTSSTTFSLQLLSVVGYFSFFCKYFICLIYFIGSIISSHTLRSLIFQD